ncbi:MULTISPECIES: CBS domain-containing protein [unclassified Kribbella]|uniref:CBS domain-containing protein n=1 Tax=unclassified Kribbella TaxID=2644121 RepID=UPI0033F746EB
MLEPVVATFMTRSPVTVTDDTPFKLVACALLASDAPAVPVLSGNRRPVGLITESDLLVNLEYHGGIDPPPLLGGVAGRRRRRKSTALTARELMSSPVSTIGADAPIGVAARSLTNPGAPPLCVVDDNLTLVGLLTRRDLICAYRRPDVDIAADIDRAINSDRRRPARSPAELTIQVDNGVVTLTGQLAYRSQVEHAIVAASRIAGVVAVHSTLVYDIDDLLVTGF